MEPRGSGAGGSRRVPKEESFKSDSTCTVTCSEVPCSGFKRFGFLAERALKGVMRGDVRRGGGVGGLADHGKMGGSTW